MLPFKAMITDRLRKALDGARAEIEAGLAEAESELEQLDRRRDDLLALIAQARAALGIELPPTAATGTTSRGLTLHQAIAQVLSDHGNEWMTARELADEVNERGLYHKRDGSAVELNQIHARTKNYASLFEKAGPRIRLRAP
jgi:HB1, ASXL, restriction endonuclease HTH domain